jgi:hypothetical protein
MFRRVTLTSIAALVLLAAATGTASAKAFKGTVVHRSAKAHSFVIADKWGRLTAIHATNSPKVGRVVKVQARRLHNGTYGLRKAKVVGASRRARLHGTVTYANRATGAFVVSARGTSIPVHRRRAQATAASDSTPSVGDVVTVEATLGDQGDIEEQSVTREGTDTNGVELHGVVLAVDNTVGAKRLSISADDDNELAGALTVLVPDSFDISQFKVGDEVELIATPNADGTYTLVGTTGDDSSEHRADKTSDDQGDTHDVGDDHGGSRGKDGKSSGDSNGSSGKRGSDDAPAPTGTPATGMAAAPETEPDGRRGGKKQ